MWLMRVIEKGAIVASIAPLLQACTSAVLVTLQVRLLDPRLPIYARLVSESHTSVNMASI